MLNIDNIREIAIQSDYVETKKIIKEFSELNNDDFWKSKCLKLFPKENYLDFYTGEENYLIRERGEFALAIDFSEECYCEKVLFEYSDMLSDILFLSVDKIHDGIGYQIHNLFKIIIQKQFIVVNNEEEDFMKQCDDKLEAIELIKQHSLIYKENKYNEHIKYIIVDLKSITPYFWKLGTLSKKRTPKFTVYEFENIQTL
jgi:hypothetical protein